MNATALQTAYRKAQHQSLVDAAAHLNNARWALASEGLADDGAEVTKLYDDITALRKRLAAVIAASNATR